MMIILSLSCILSLTLGGMLLISPDTLYGFNEYIIDILYKIGVYVNQIILKLGRYINKTCISSQGNFACRMAIAGSSIFAGLCMGYVVYYYSQYNAFPPMVNHWITNFLVHFESACQQSLIGLRLRIVDFAAIWRLF